MADGVRVALNTFWTLVRNWKKGKSAELRLHSDHYRLTVKYSLDLVVWVPPSAPRPPRESASRGHQGPRKGAGPSRQRRRKRRAAAKEATADANENVVEATLAPQKTAEEAEINIIDQAAPLEELRTTPGKENASLTLTPVRAVREEEGDQCKETFENNGLI